MSDFKRAKDDLLFFSKRFKGILDIIPDLEKISNINNYIREKEKHLKDLDKRDIACSEASNELLKDVDVLQKRADTLINNANEIVRKQGDKYLIWEERQRIQLEEEFRDKRKVFGEENRALTQKIVSKRQELEDLVNNTKEATDRYETIKKTIDDLRGRL